MNYPGSYRFHSIIFGSYHWLNGYFTCCNWEHLVSLKTGGFSLGEVHFLTYFICLTHAPLVKFRKKNIDRKYQQSFKVVQYKIPFATVWLCHYFAMQRQMVWADWSSGSFCGTNLVIRASCLTSNRDLDFKSFHCRLPHSCRFSWPLHSASPFPAPLLTINEQQSLVHSLWML